jgi:hypothetical protein
MFKHFILLIFNIIKLNLGIFSNELILDIKFINKNLNIY